jgi:DNA-binding response OmpR family regulator
LIANPLRLRTKSNSTVIREISVPEISPIPESEVKARLLVADAEASSRALVAETLRRDGYSVDEVGSSGEALQFLESQPCDLVVLDIILPGIGGVEVMRQARQMHRDLLIVVLTAHATVESAIAAVKLNAVDYVIKPCKLDDLSVTIARALEERAQEARHHHLLSLVGEAMDALRQPKLADPAPVLPPAPTIPIRSTDLQVGVLTLDRQKRQVTLDITPPHVVELTEGECSILVALMEKPNQVLSYNDLAKTALGYDGMDKWTVESVIRSTVFRLRHKIEPGPNTPVLIRTVRGRGYFFSPA